MAFDETYDEEGDDWEWSDELQWHVERLLDGTLTLEVFREWYLSETAPAMSSSEIKAASEQMMREWLSEGLRENIVKALRDAK